MARHLGGAVFVERESERVSDRERRREGEDGWIYRKEEREREIKRKNEQKIGNQQR